MRRGRRVAPFPLLALLAPLLIPAVADSAPGPASPPEVRVATIRSDPPTGGRASEPAAHLVRPGSEDRVGRPITATTTTTGPRPLAPSVLLPPGAFDGVPNLNLVTPGDPTGALGMTNHVAAVNVHMSAYDATTGLELYPPKRLRSLDESLPSGVTDFDPKVVYDPYEGVFLLTFASTSNNASFLSIVVIHEGDEDNENQDGWCTLHMDGDLVDGHGNLTADYPMLGFTSNRVTLATNQFDFSTLRPTFRYAQIVSMKKSDLYDCAVSPVPIKVFSRRQTRDPDGSKAFTIVPAISNGGARTVQHMVSMDFNGTTGKVILWRLKRAGGSLKLTRASVSSGPMDLPPFGYQCGSTTRNTWWDTGDLRLTTAFFDGDLGRLYTATSALGNVGGGISESVLKWWEIDPAAAVGDSTVTRKATHGAADRDLGWPSVATDGNGKLWLNYARAGLDECLSAYAAVVQPGETSASALRYRLGDARYERQSGAERWGDYTAIARDPQAPTVMAVYDAYPLDDGAGATDVWQQVIATVEDV